MRKNKAFKVILAVVFSIALSMTALFTFGCNPEETPVFYTVTFQTNGGSAISPQQVESGKTATEPAAPTKSGYTFGGWYEDEQLNTAYVFTTEVTKDITLYADWDEVEKFTVTFDSAKGSPVAAQTVESGKKVEKPADPTREGYTFTAWITTDGTAYDFTTPVTKEFTLYANWTKVNDPTPTTYAVTFDMQGHGTAPSAQTVNSGEHATVPATAPTAEGWIFGGWYKEETCTNVFNFETETITSATTVYAKWTEDQGGDTPVTHSVTFDMQGHGTAPAAQTVATGGHATAPATAPTAEGWTFGGWYKESTCTNVFNFETETITSATTVYAKWTENQGGDTPTPPVPGDKVYYTVTFANCTGVPQQRVESGNTAARPETPVQSGKVFEGWYEDESYSTAYDFGTAVSTNTTLYAKWVNGTFTVTFNGKGGKFETMDNKEVIQVIINNGSKAVEPTAPVKANATFAGWFDNENCEGTAFNFNEAVSADVTLYAKWTENGSQEPTTPVTPPAGNKLTATSINFNSIELTDTIEKSDGTTYQGKNLEAGYAVDEKGIVTLKGGAWEVDANNGNITDASGSAVKATNRLKSKSATRSMEINLSEYTGKVKLQFFVRTASKSDLERGVKLSDAAGSELGSITLTEDKVFTFEVTVDCGAIYTLSVIKNGVNFYGINIIPVD